MRRTRSKHVESTSGGLRRRLRTSSAVAVAVAVVALGLSACRLNPPEVVVYGDSLISQAMPYIQHDLTSQGQSNVVFNAYPGTAPCDWMNQMLADAQANVMTAAVIEFSGNNFGCMSYPAASPAFFAAYQQQVTQAVQAFVSRGIHVFLVGAPVTLKEIQQGATTWDHLNEIYAQIAASEPNATYVNAGAAVEENGSFTWTLPCRPGEPSCLANGQAIVRAADGQHFCPQQAGDGSQCLDYSSGAARYADALTAPVDPFLGGQGAPVYVGPPLPAPGTAPHMAPGQQGDPIAGVPDALTTGQVLAPGQGLHSVSGAFTAVLQGDGNFVLYGPFGPLWSSNTAGTGADALVMQTDGNLVLYAGTRPVWSTNTTGTGANYLALQDDGNLVLYDFNTSYWQSGPA